MKILFIVKEKSDFNYLLNMYDKSQVEAPDEIALLLIHDAVLVEINSDNDFRIFACSDDVKARGVSVSFDTLDYKQMLKLMSDYDKVICW